MRFAVPILLTLTASCLAQSIIEQEVPANELKSVVVERPGLWIVRHPSRTWPHEVCYTKEGKQKFIIWTGGKNQLIEVEVWRIPKQEGALLPEMETYLLTVVNGKEPDDDKPDVVPPDDGIDDRVVPPDDLPDSKYGVGPKIAHIFVTSSAAERRAVANVFIQARLATKSGAFRDVGQAAREVVLSVQATGIPNSTVLAEAVRKVLDEAHKQNKFRTMLEFGYAFGEVAEHLMKR